MPIRLLGGPFNGSVSPKWPFLGTNKHFLVQIIFLDTSSKFGLPSWRDTKITTVLCWPRCRSGSWGGARAHFCPKMGHKLVFLRYTHINQFFWAQTDPTQWDHNIPISWGNSGYLWFSGRCPFGCSAGRCMGPIAENYHFWVWYCMELNCILWYCIISYGIELYLMVLLWYCLVLHGIAWYCKMLHCIVRYRIVSY